MFFCVALLKLAALSKPRRNKIVNVLEPSSLEHKNVTDDDEGDDDGDIDDGACDDDDDSKE